MKTTLRGGCYVLDPFTPERGELTPLINAESGAKHLSQFVLDLGKGDVRSFAFRGADVVVFAVSGAAGAVIGGRGFEVPEHSGLHVRPGEALQLEPTGDFKALITVCPEAAAEEPDGQADVFNEDFPRRVVEIDPAKKEASGDRFYQVLVSTGIGSRNITQFLGEIPVSKAPSHHHLYEEALFVLEGEGFMWTEDLKGAVRPGSVIFLPRKQEHALECTSASGLRVAGHFYPTGSPAENY